MTAIGHPRARGLRSQRPDTRGVDLLRLTGSSDCEKVEAIADTTL